MVRKRLTAMLLCGAMALSFAQPTFADKKSDLQNKVQENQNALDSTNETIKNEQDANNALLQDISELDSQLLDLLTNIDVIKSDISNTEDKLAQNEKDLAAAEDDRDTQYAGMSGRIKYIYENNNKLGWIGYVLEAKDLSDFLNRITYANTLYSYDRKQLKKYEESIAAIESIQTELNQTKDALTEEEYSLEEQQTSLNEALAQKQAQSDNYEAEIEELKTKAAELAGNIATQNAELKKIEQEELEAARKAAEEAAARAAAESKAASDAAASEAAAAASSAASSASSSTSNSGNTGTTASSNTSSNTNSSGNTSSSSQSTNTSGKNIGQQIADYACQWIGNPYVSGGCSLTNGADCAGFVYSVYLHFGVTLIRNPDIQGTQYGRQVSLSEIKPGDIVCYYGGHSAICIGNNTVVHASNPSVGITTTTPINYRSIRGIARLFDY